MAGEGFKSNYAKSVSFYAELGTQNGLRRKEEVFSVRNLSKVKPKYNQIQLFDGNWLCTNKYLHFFQFTEQLKEGE